jgi:hypothetical protein
VADSTPDQPHPKSAVKGLSQKHQNRIGEYTRWLPGNLGGDAGASWRHQEIPTQAHI